MTISAQADSARVDFRVVRLVPVGVFPVASNLAASVPVVRVVGCPEASPAEVLLAPADYPVQVRDRQVGPVDFPANREVVLRAVSVPVVREVDCLEASPAEVLLAQGDYLVSPAAVLQAASAPVVRAVDCPEASPAVVLHAPADYLVQAQDRPAGPEADCRVNRVVLLAVDCRVDNQAEVRLDQVVCPVDNLAVPLQVALPGQVADCLADNQAVVLLAPADYPAQALVRHRVRGDLARKVVARRVV